MGVTVEDGKQANDDDASDERQPCCCRDEDAEQEDGNHHALLDKRSGNTSHAEKTADGHNADEPQRNEPYETATALRSPKTNSNHRADVVEAADGMSKAVQQPARVADADMGMNERREKDSNQSKKEWRAAKE